MVLQLHLSECRLQRACAVSVPLLPGRSIIAGCSFSIPLTRLYLKRKMDLQVASHTLVQHGVFVDDIGQQAAGSTLGVRRAIVDAALDLVKIALTLRLNNFLQVCCCSFAACHSQSACFQAGQGWGVCSGLFGGA